MFRVGGKKKLDFFFPPKNYEMRLVGRWWSGHFTEWLILRKFRTRLLPGMFLRRTSRRNSTDDFPCCSVRGPWQCHMGLTICTMIEIVLSGFLDGVLGFLVQR